MKARKYRNQAGRKPALNVIGAAVAATLIASGAQAADITVDQAAPGTVVNGQLTHDIVLPNIGAVSATVTTTGTNIVTDGVVTGSTLVTSNNGAHASATANTIDNSIDAAALTTGSDGAASLGVATNIGAAAVTSTAGANTLGVNTNGFEDGSVAVNGNAISATTTVNNGVSSIAGQVPTSYASTEVGSAVLNTGTPTAVLATSGSLVSASVQQSSEAAASSAVASSNSIAATLTHDDDGNVISSATTVDGNSIAATLRGNAATSVIDVQAGTTPAFTGSAAVSNAQLRDGAASSALNTGSFIGAVVESSGAATNAVNTLSGAVSVQDNTISSAATGNQSLGTSGVAGNRILLGDGVSYAAPVGQTTANSTAYDAGDVATTANAGLAIVNSQGNTGTANITSTTAGAEISTNAQSLVSGSIQLNDNAITSAASGNAASSALASGTGAASFTGSAAIANQQANNAADIAAATTGTAIVSVTGYNVNTPSTATAGGVTHDSTVTATGNRSSATAYGNDASQSIALDANSVALNGGSTATLSGGRLGSTNDGNVSADGSVTVTNLQSNYGSSVTASNTGSLIGIAADSRDGNAAPGNVVQDSDLSTTDNRQEAVAVGNLGSSSLGLSGNNVGAGAGVSSTQIVATGAAVSATLAASAVGVVSGTHVSGSTLTVEDNLQRAIGYGNSATNALSVDANQANVVDTTGTASVVNYSAANGFDSATAQPTVNAAYGVLSNQSVQSSVSGLAAAQPSLQVEGNVVNSTTTLNGNALVGAAYGNDAANRISVNAGSLGGVGLAANVANVTSTQSVLGDATAVTARALGTVLTDIEDNVTSASVTTDGNAIQALAVGSRATNSLTGSGTAIQTDGGASATVVGAALTTAAAFSVQNAQSGAGSVVASQLNDVPTPTLASGVRVEVGTVPGPLINGTLPYTQVLGSTISASSNSSSASATSNSSANSLSLTANALQSGTAVQNFQTTSADVSALIGLAGTAGSLGGPFSYTIVDLDDNWVHSGSAFTGGTLYINTATGLTGDQIVYLQNNGWTLSGGYLSRNASGYTATALEYASGSFGRNAATADSIGSPNQGGVTLAVQGLTTVGNEARVTNSQLTVANNTNSGSVTGNAATNSTTLTDINALSTTTTALGSATAAPLSSAVAAAADHVLTNAQSVTGDGTTLTSSVYGAFAIDVAENALISASTLSVDGNAQRATAVANTAANGLVLSGNAITATSALASAQDSAAAVSALSNAELYSPAAVTNSSVSLSGNSNVALGVINDVTNTLSVTGTSVANSAYDAATLDAGNATAAHALNNAQTASTSVSSSAVTRLYNQDRVDTATGGIQTSSVTLEGNSTVAEASANRATNTVSVEGGSSLAASAGLLNQQFSSAAVSADSNTQATVALNGTATPTAALALNGSTVALEGNSTTALARGNSATNVLNATAGANYVGIDAIGGSAVPGTTTAQAAILNLQGNSGNVTATGTGRYTVALNGLATSASDTVAGSTVSVKGNITAASAYGNSATNALTLSTPTTGTPTAAVTNYQSNSGAIVAVATSVNYGSNILGTTTGSTLRATGNQVAATAVGNSATSSIVAAR